MLESLLIEPWVPGRWGEGGMKAGGCVSLEASGCCEDPVIEKVAQVGLLLLDWEESFEAGLRWG